MNIEKLQGVGARRAHSLHKVGLFNVSDLLNYYPRDYDDRSDVKEIASLVPDTVGTIMGRIHAPPVSSQVRRKNAPPLNLTKLTIKDASGSVDIVWYNQPYLAKQFKVGQDYIFTGKIKATYQQKIEIQSPEYELFTEDSLSHGRITPIYTTPPQFSQKTFRKLMGQALQASFESTGAFREYLPEKIRQAYGLLPRKDAIHHIHFPQSDTLFLQARNRLVFEELFFMQLALQHIKKGVKSQHGIQLADVDPGPFLQQLPFSLTRAQEKVLADIQQDLSKGQRMHRLVQGDVGSGKTAVAMICSYLLIKNGYQVALMAPTDVLANQHFLECEKYLSPLGIKTVLLTGSLGAKAKRENLLTIENGSGHMIVGTHALIQEKVTYHNLGLAITDEQHRFGVNQRLILSQKGDMAHTLVMTATPIPRTLGLILYGDLDISIIDQLPPGRQVIKTYSVGESYRPRLEKFILKEVESGRQVYVICPAIESQEEDPAGSDENENQSKKEMKNVLDYTAQLQASLPTLSIASLHGKMKPADKQEIMDRFKSGHTHLLVSTTVIEVGVHVANATLMLVENAERFGLSQLHQLRGRVGRGQHQSYCILVTDSKGKETKTRMKAMCDTADGFKLAELDLKIRGAGDFFGTRQHGLPGFKIANLYRDMDVLTMAQDAVAHYKEDPLVEMRLHTVLEETNAGVM